MAIFYRRDRFEPLEYDHFWFVRHPGDGVFDLGKYRIAEW